MDNLVEVKNIVKNFPVTSGLFKDFNTVVHALSGVSFNIRRGETLGLVGESGCGKSTLGRIIANLMKPTSGNVIYEGKNITNLKPKEFKTFRRNIQLVFQDPYASLNPRMTVGQIIGEGLIIYNIAKGEVNRKKVLEILDVVGLTKDSISRYPHEFSGGQRQRIGIARALSLSPKLIIADEPISALDVSIQAQILNLLNKLQKQFGFTYLFIAHDLRIVEYISDRVIVMYLGKIMEIADSKALYKIPYHPYTEALISSIPAINSEKKEKRIILKDDIPSPINLPSGCQFHTRCRYSTIKCQREEPELIEKNGRYFSCHFPLFD